MSSLTSCALAQVAAIVRGVTYARDDVSDYPKPRFSPLLRAGNISFRLDTDTDLVWVPDELISREQRLQKDDIVMCTSSGSMHVLGKSAILDHPFKGTVGAFCAIIRAKPWVLPRFLSYWLGSSDFRFWRDAKALGININNLRLSDLAAISIPLPPLSEQRRIIEILDQADQIRKLRSDADVRAAQILPALFTHMFGLDRSSRSIWTSQPLAQLLQSKKGSLQSGPFGSHLHNSDFVESGQVLVVGIDNVHDSGFEIGRNRRITREKYSELQKFTLEPGDVLITIMGSVGRTCVFPEWAGLAICSKHVYRIQVKRLQLEPEYLCDYLKYATDARAQLGASATGQIVAGITSKALKELRIMVPPLELQGDYVRRKKALTDTSGYRARSKDALERLFATLLHRAFTGDLTASWRKAHMNELLQEMELQAKALASLEAGR